MVGLVACAPVTCASAPAAVAVGPFTYFSSMLMVQAASAAVSGFPSDHLAFGRVWKVQVRPSGDSVQLVAKSGTISRFALYWVSWG